MASLGRGSLCRTCCAWSAQGCRDWGGRRSRVQILQAFHFVSCSFASVSWFVRVFCFSWSSLLLGFAFLHQANMCTPPLYARDKQVKAPVAGTPEGHARPDMQVDRVDYKACSWSPAPHVDWKAMPASVHVLPGEPGAIPCHICCLDPTSTTGVPFLSLPTSYPCHLDSTCLSAAT